MKRIKISRLFDYHMFDMAVAFYRVISGRFGEDAFGGVWRYYLDKGYFGTYAPNFLTIKNGPHKTAQGITGPVSVRSVPGFFIVGGNNGDSIIMANVRQSFKASAEKILEDVQKYLEQHSIYRHKALTVGSDGAVGFFDFSAVDSAKLVYNEKVWRDLRAHVWTLIESADFCRKANIQLQRKVLFAGPFGSGKTLAALMTAQKAVENNMTFVYLEPTVKKASDMITSVLDFARKYAPSVVLIEDFDREQRESDMYALGRIMNSIDSIISKQSDILIILTTNHAEKLAPGMQRPGRIDKTIRFDIFSQEDVKALLLKIIPQEFLYGQIDWPAVTSICENYTQAFVGEVGNSAKLMAISDAKRNGGDPKITQEMLVESARDLQAQNKACRQELGFKT